MIDQQTIIRIKETANIVEVVSDFVTLRRSGANYKGLCPFHNERTPSFIVSPARGTCHCFGCGKGGNPVSFIMEHEQLSYPDALRWLARKYGIEVEEKELTAEERQAQNQRDSMFIINEWAADYFENQLQTPDGQAIGMAYFRSRGFRDDIIKKFRLGYDGGARQALPTAAKQASYNPDYLLSTGICYQNDRGQLIDRYSNRVVFPWLSISGKVVGFSARLLVAATKGVAQKYVNSPDSEIYHKDRELFGLFQAKREIAKSDRVYIVEGQTDVIAMHQCGIENVVANSGTALSIHQIHILHRFTNNITLLYDGDEAGMHAALRGTDMLLAEGVNVKVLFLPDGDDPDSFARKHTAAQFREYIEKNQKDFIQFKVDHLLRGVTDPQQRTEAIDSIIRSISVVPNPVLRDTYIHESAVRIGINESTIIQRLNSFIRENKQRATTGQGATGATGATTNTTTNTTTTSGTPSSTATNTANASTIGTNGTLQIEHALILLVLLYGEQRVFDSNDDENNDLADVSIAQYIHDALADDDISLSEPLYQLALSEAYVQSDDDKFNAQNYFLNHENIHINRLVVDMLTEELRAGNKNTDLKQRALRVVLELRLQIVDTRLKALKLEIIQQSLSPEQLQELMSKYSETQRTRNELARQLGLAVGRA